MSPQNLALTVIQTPDRPANNRPPYPQNGAHNKGSLAIEHTMKTHKGRRSYSCALSLTPALDGGGGQRHAPAALYPQERPGTHCIGGWVGPTASLDGRKISSPTEIGSPDRPTCSESLYRLSYPATKCSPKFISILYCNDRCTLLVAQLVEALRYKPEGRGFDSRWCHWNSSLT